MAKKRKYLTIDKVFGECFNLYFKNILKIITPIAVVIIPFMFLFYKWFQTILNEDYTYDQYPPELIVGMILFSLLYFLVFFIEIKIISNAYLDKKESIPEIIQDALKRFFPFFLANILLALGYIGGFLLLIVPGYILLFGWSVAHAVFVIEKKGPINSIKRSWELTKGHKGIIFLVYLLLYFTMYFIFLVLYIITIIIVMFILTLSAEGITGAMQGEFGTDTFGYLIPIIFVVISFIYIFLIPLYPTFITVIYYNLKKEKENFATEQLADSFLEDDSENIKKELE
ncbi:MAG: hypothetical protein GY756_25420 [bacterium]|nr:hypothetical protein [bacterium]